MASRRDVQATGLEKRQRSIAKSSMELETKPTFNMLPVVLYVASTVLNDISSLDVPHPLCLYIHTIQVFRKVTTQLSPLEYITKQNKLCCDT